MRRIGPAVFLLLLPCVGASPRAASPAQAGEAPGVPMAGVVHAPAPPPFALAQAVPPSALPSLVLPPDATAQPEAFVTMMRMGDQAMLRRDVVRARNFYERAAVMRPASSDASLAAGKTYDPNVLSLLGVTDGNLADPGRARVWYERARALGSPGAPLLLAPLR